MDDSSLQSAAHELKRPLHLRVRDALRKLILEQFEDGQKFYSERILIQKLNYSQPTVRRALVDLASEGHLVAEPRRGFFVRRLVETRHVGIIVPYNKDPAERLIESIAEACSERQYLMHIYYARPEDSAKKMVSRIGHRQIEERVLLSGFSTQVVQELEVELRQTGYQSLVIGGVAPTFAGSAVSIDHAAESKMLLDYLTEMGHQRMLFLVNEPQELLTTSRRTQAIEAELAERKLPAEIVFCHTPMGESSFNAAYKYTELAMANKTRPTVIVPLSGVGAWAALRYMVERKISVPDEVSIFCFDPVIGTALLPIPLTGFFYDQHERTRLAVELLWKDSLRPNHHFIKPELVIRSSVGRPIEK